MNWSGDFYAHHDAWETDVVDDRYYQSPVYYKYEFNTEEQLISSSIFQKCLGQALAHKDQEIEALRRELINVHTYWNK